MALASSSSSVLRSSGRLATAAPAMSGRVAMASSRRSAVEARTYTNSASPSGASLSSQPLDLPPTTRPRVNSVYSRSTPTSNSRSNTTASSAQAYLTDLLSLPSSRQFPPELALQMVTHKSYRYAHPIRHLQDHDMSESGSASTSGVGSEPHNSRLSFLGRRALATYLSIFAHDAFSANASGNGSSARILREEGSDFLRGLGLEERLENLRHTNNLGRTVGTEWRIGDVIRWDRNETSRESGDLKIRGMAVEAILGGIFTHFGSPAAHRAFHLHVLPHLIPQLRDPRLVERVNGLKDELNRDFGGVLPRV